MRPLAASDPASQALSGLAGVLETPVHVLAVLLLGVLAYELGGLAMEAWRRISPRARPVQETAGHALADPDAAAGIARDAPGPLTERAVLDLALAVRSPREDAIENALAGYELRIQRKLDRTRMLVRAGPALGLMGTLIPSPPGLSALGDGNYQQLAGDLRRRSRRRSSASSSAPGAYVLTLCARGTTPRTWRGWSVPSRGAGRTSRRTGGRGRRRRGGAVSRVGLGRHGQLDDSAGDPLDGLVNLFDVGIVLAVAFLIAGWRWGPRSREGADAGDEPRRRRR